MFKNKKLEVKLVDDSHMPNYMPNPKMHTEDVLAFAKDAAKDVIKGTAVIMATYIAADTLRRAAVHIIATKIK